MLKIKIIIQKKDNIFKSTAKLILKLSKKSKHKIFTVALSGGTSPISLFKILASDYFRNKINWNKIHFFQVDERCVPIGDNNRNHKMINKNLFIPLNIPLNNIHFFQKDLNDPEESAKNYQSEIINFFNNDLPSFDLILLGIGEDGHTASLFPDELESSINIDKLVICTKSNFLEPKVARVTLTLKLINNAKNIIFSASGDSKKEIIQKIIKRDLKLPASHVNPKENIFLFYDQKII